jgi:hypothetical protein
VNHRTGAALRIALALGLLAASTGAPAITITATQDASLLVNALLAGASTGILVTGATLNAQVEVVDLGQIGGTGTATVSSSGTYTNASGTYGVGPGVVLSTGAVQGFVSPDPDQREDASGYSDGADLRDNNSWGYSDPVTFLRPASPEQEALLDPITANGDPACQPSCTHYDVTELIINFDMQPGVTEVSFNIVFGSEEWEEFRDSQFVDGFGMFLNGVNIASVLGQPVNIQHPETRPLLDAFGLPIAGTEIAGTELDGILAPNGNPLLTFSGLVNPSGNTLRFIVADTEDNIYDTTVYFSALTGVPAPPAVWLLGTGLAGLAGRRLLAGRRPPVAT